MSGHFFPAKPEFWSQQSFDEILAPPLSGCEHRTSHYNSLSPGPSSAEPDHTARLHRTVEGCVGSAGVVPISLAEGPAHGRCSLSDR